MLAKSVVFLCLLSGASTLHAQAGTTASRLADAQVGIGYILATPDYVNNTFQGFAAYGDLDLTPRLGVEAEFHQINSTSGNQIYERTYEVGGRYFHTYGPLVPYFKGMVGRGVFNYPNGVANIAYNLLAGGAGVDLKVSPNLHVRGDFEFQKWLNFTNSGLEPRLVTIGVAYHFDGKPRYGK